MNSNDIKATLLTYPAAFCSKSLVTLRVLIVLIKIPPYSGDVMTCVC